MNQAVVILTAAAVLSACAEHIDEEQLALYARGAELYRAGNFAAAVALLREAGDFPQALLLRGKGEYFSGDTAAAEKTLRRVRRKNRSPEAALYLARIYREQGDGEQARGMVESVLAAAPGDAGALRLAAMIAADNGDTAAASALLERAAEASAEAAMVFLDRARLRWVSGRAKEAAADLERVKILLPEGSALGKSAEHLRQTIEENNDEK